MTKAQRLEALHRRRHQCVAVVRFTRELSEWDPETFVRTVLVDWLRVSEVWVGANFLFGHGRSGNFTRAAHARAALRLSRRQDRSGALQGLRGEQHAHPPARVARAAWTKRARCSGIRTIVDGTVVEGRKRGREIGFPTANLETENELVPPHGVYATTMTIDGIVHAGITNIGVRPTFGETESTIETHLLRLLGRSLRSAGAAGDSCSGCATSAGFADVDALRAQIEADRRARRAAVQPVLRCSVDASDLRVHDLGATRRRSLRPWSAASPCRPRAMPACGDADAADLRPRRSKLRCMRCLRDGVTRARASP